MTRIFDPDSETDIPHKVIINLDRDNADHLGQASQDNFLTSINHARTLCSGDAHSPQGIRYTVNDPGSPLLLLIDRSDLMSAPLGFNIELLDPLSSSLPVHILRVNW